MYSQLSSEHRIRLLPSCCSAADIRLALSLSIYILVNESVHKAWCCTHIYNIRYVEGHESPAKGNTTTCIRSFLANIEYVCCLLAAAPQIYDLHFLCQFIYLLTNQHTKLGGAPCQQSSVHSSARASRSSTGGVQGHVVVCASISNGGSKSPGSTTRGARWQQPT